MLRPLLRTNPKFIGAELESIPRSALSLHEESHFSANGGVAPSGSATLNTSSVIATRP